MKKTLLSLLIGGTLMAGTLTAMTFTGENDLSQVEETAQQFISKAQAYVTAVGELEALASQQNVDITTLINKINDLKQTKADLMADIDSLNQQLEDSKGSNSTLAAEVERLTSELNKANDELTEANNLVAAYKDTMNTLLDDSMFGEVKTPTRIDISEAVADDEAN